MHGSDSQAGAVAASVLDVHSRPMLLRNIVDDEPGMVSLVSRFATDHGFDVIGRSGGLQMLGELSSLKADAAIVDLRMPEVGGIEVLKAIHDADPACQVIQSEASHLDQRSPPIR